jgi:hypothetical protein
MVLTGVLPTIGANSNIHSAHGGRLDRGVARGARAALKNDLRAQPDHPGNPEPDPWLGRVKAKQIKRLRVFEITLDTRSEPNHPIAMACPTASSAA